LPSPLQAQEVVINGQSLSPEPLENPSLDPLGEVVRCWAGRSALWAGPANEPQHAAHRPSVMRLKSTLLGRPTLLRRGGIKGSIRSQTGSGSSQEARLL
jgi:hypothetical protein